MVAVDVAPIRYPAFSVTVTTPITGATRIADLKGAVIGFVDNSKQNADHFIERVDALLREFCGYCLYARAAHTDAGADRINARILGMHGDLGTRAGVACGALDLKQTFLDLGNLEFKQLGNEFRCGARQHQVRAAGEAVNLPDIGSHAITQTKILLRDHLVAGQHGFETAGFDNRVAALHAFDDAGDKVLLAGEEVIKDLLAFRVTDLLHDDLFSGLRTNAADFHALERLFDELADLGFRIFFLRLMQLVLPRRHFDFLVLHHFPATEEGKFAGRTIDRGANLDVLGELLFGCRSQGEFERAEHNFLVDVLFSRQRINQQQNFTTHIRLPLKTPASAALYPHCPSRPTARVRQPRYLLCLPRTRGSRQ